MMSIEVEPLRGELQISLPGYLSALKATLPIEAEEVGFAVKEGDLWFLVSTLVNYLKKAFASHLVLSQPVGFSGLHEVISSTLAKVESGNLKKSEHCLLYTDLLDAALAFGIRASNDGIVEDVFEANKKEPPIFGAERDLLDIYLTSRILRLALFDDWESVGSVLNGVSQDLTVFHDDSTQQLLRYLHVLLNLKMSGREVWRKGAEAWVSIISVWWLLGSARMESTIPSFRLFLALMLGEKCGFKIPDVPFTEKLLDDLERCHSILAQ